MKAIKLENAVESNGPPFLGPLGLNTAILAATDTHLFHENFVSVNTGIYFAVYRAIICFTDG